MKTTKLAFAAASLLTALTVTAGAAQAHPVTEQQAPIGFAAETDTTGRALISIDAGSLVVEDNTLKIKAADGTTVAGTSLSFRIDEFEFPIAAVVTDRHATLTPQIDPAKAVYKPVALPFENSAPWKSEYEREQAAWSRMTGTIGLGASVGALVGGISGGAVGCVLGGIVGATVASATIVGLFGPFLPAAAVGCIGGILAMGSLGALAGQIFIAAPVAIGAAIQYFTTINAPFTPAAK
ncbi:hypothetical protein [Nocardia fluminea]|uniref:DUF8020 domain-containing protein n=1 Tax=Nocardia fluminea TaxID=134984 RepID=A0A2N3VDK2_9NOCA|nr:hypothetical protein [Nocardia fluminea]PKV79677.1 hypothetical protein ATK86_4086 [Nocardia fluminea]